MAAFAQDTPAAFSKELIDTLDPAVVMISVQSIPINGESSMYPGTGFIVDAKDGIIVTARHVVGTGPAAFTVTLSNHEELRNVHRMDVDPKLDIAFLKFDTTTLSAPLQDVVLNTERPPVGSNALLIAYCAMKHTVLPGTIADNRKLTLVTQVHHSPCHNT